VDRTVSQPEGTLVNVLIKPAANLERLEEVLIITNTGSQMPSGMQQDLSDSQQKASDILAERLPSRADPNAPPPVVSGQTGTAAVQGAAAPSSGPDNSLPTPPPKPPPAIHADRYSTSSVQPAAEMVPGQRASGVDAPSTSETSGHVEAPATVKRPAPTVADSSVAPAKKTPARPAPAEEKSGATGASPAPENPNAQNPKPVKPKPAQPNSAQPDKSPPPITAPPSTPPQGTN
jgi:rod shape-determining protein MreC